MGMSGVEKLGPEFYGEGCSKPFPSLEKLTFLNMEEWKDWFSFGVDEEVEPFTCLFNLSIQCCRKLLGELPKNLPSLKELVIEKCPQLVVALPSFGKLRNSVDVSSLNYLRIEDVSIPAPRCNPDVADAVVLTCNHLKSLKRLIVANIQKLTSLPLWFIQGLLGLEELTINRCGELASLWQNEVRLQHHLPALRRLVIWRCPQLVCLFEEQEGQHEELPCMTMQIYNCEKLELPRDLRTFMFLRDLTLRGCQRLISFSETCLPSTLRTLAIYNCRALNSLTEGLMHNNSLEVLHVSRCPSLTSLSSRCALPPTLKVLGISSCENLESIVVVDEGLKNNPFLDIVKIKHCKNLKSLPDGPHNLSQLQINGCDNLESLPEGWLSATSLRELKIFDCTKLVAMPNNVHNLTSLQHLELQVCPGAVSYFFQGNFPTNLNSLFLSNIPSPSEWGLHRLSCLTKLHLFQMDLVSFPEGGMLLPTSLTEVWIENFPNLEYLSSEFQNLISLEYLHIRNCPKLTSFPDQGLPQSLLKLRIWECPLLQQRCKRERGQYWPMIAHIPCIEINRRSIFALEVD